MEISRFFWLVLAVCLSLAPVGAKPLFDSESKMINLFSDQKAHRIGDIVTIAVSESMTNQKTDSKKIAKDYSISQIAGIGIFKFLEALGIAGKSGANVNRSNTESEKFTATLTTRIVEILPNGDFRVEGKKELTLEKNKRTITISGIVRPEDIDNTNSVSSSKVADVKVDSQDAGRSPGILTRILRFLF
ncbi:MAG: flagellar basal body L-ring protein FlgH [Armatimonadetes bacterium]|nr:flagellar basal body L-ring protein FlgH [Armatimonadota bacterium]